MLIHLDSYKFYEENKNEFIDFILALSTVGTGTPTGFNRTAVALQNATSDSLRMINSRSIGYNYQEINRDSALKYNSIALLLAQKLNCKINEADILDGQGYVYTMIGKYPEALTFENHALKLAEDLSIENLPNFPMYDYKTTNRFRLGILSSIYHDLGHLYGLTGDAKNYSK